MSTTFEPGPAHRGTPETPASADRPNRRQRIPRGMAAELGGAAASSFALMWLIFAITDPGQSAFGFFVCWLLGFFLIFAIVAWRLHGVLLMKDRLGTVAVWGGSFVALLPLVVIIIYVIIEGSQALFAAFPHFFTADMSQFSGQTPIGTAGMGAAIVGTVEQVALTTLFSVPIAVLAATYLNETRGAMANFVRTVVDSMTGTPSIIAGLFVYLFWVEPRGVNGKSGLAAALALTVLMLPFVTRSAEEVLTVVPGSLREAALALGAPQWKVVVKVVLPTARTGLVTAVILGIARTVGETAPVLLTTSASAHFNWNPFHGIQSNLPLEIYSLIVSPGTNSTKVAWGGAFVLVLVVLTLFTLARILGSSRTGHRSSPWRRLTRQAAPS
jgi:phosphate transport system permease protein